MAGRGCCKKVVNKRGWVEEGWWSKMEERVGRGAG